MVFGRGRRERNLMPPPPEYGPSVPKPFSELMTQGPMTPLERLARQSRIPDEARTLVVQIDTEATQAVQYIAAHGITGLEAFEVERIRDEHAPASVRSYLDLPPGTADTVPLQDGRTGTQLLIDELEVLLNAVRKAVAAVGVSGQVQAVVNHRFLVDKYGDRDLRLSLDEPDQRD
ncbi:hypothetical protein [Rudaeicoccus suwonensis]|uniref:Uncharacterized protein n=1 Tax=Rudaeicoccus suwonensis TaxID=657409 RepID=A0A561E145_9MICO|nr:hypothetical protein [Rudaeicoccus suwonensis]TWE09312.1 hypothetical protein BKA23_3012 [Rudaeicoccus suwonensis]